MKGLSETVKLGETLQLVARPLEVVAALQQLQQAYSHYYVAVNSYNRAQFRMFRALGYPAEDLATRPELGNPQPIDTTRPCPLPPVPLRKQQVRALRSFVSSEKRIGRRGIGD